jgi:protein ImuB
MLGLDRITRARTPPRSAAPGEPPARVLVARVANAERVVLACPRAAAAGVAPGTSLADARARLPALEVHAADPGAERALLETVADWAGRWTPLVATDGDDGLLMEVAGCAHLFGGEEAMLADVVAGLARSGFLARAALGPNAVAARALALGAPGAIAPEGGDVAAILAPLPLATLPLPAAMTAELARLGLATIGDLLERPRAPLVKRFGRRLGEVLDQATGARGAPISPRGHAALYLAERRFAEPLSHRDDIVGVARALAGSLCELLARHDEGARRLELALFRVDGGVVTIDVGTSRPTRDPALLAGLIGHKLDALAETLDIGFGLDVVRLSLIETGGARAAQVRLDGAADDSEGFARLVDRLGARFGERALRRLVPLASHVPERAVASVPALLSGDVGARAVWPPAAAEGDPPERPLRLLPAPEPVEALASVPDGPPLRFRWRRALHEVVSAEGPERVSPEWWREPKAATRDYFRVEDAAGARFWLYRDGLWGEGAEPPRWYVHGLFA